YFGADHTHTTAAGARLTAAVVAEEIGRPEGCPLRRHLAPAADGNGRGPHAPAPDPSPGPREAETKQQRPRPTAAARLPTVRGDVVYATHLDTRATREVAAFPPGFRRGSGLAVNADETLLAGSLVEIGRGTTSPPAPDREDPRRTGRRRGGLEARWAARLPM